MSDEPFQNGANGDGRDANGRFVNRPGPGAPPNKHRARLAKAIRSRDIDKAVKLLRTLLDDGEAPAAARISAAREILDRACGRPVPADLLERIETLEIIMEQKNAKPE